MVKKKKIVMCVAGIALFLFRCAQEEVRVIPVIPPVSQNQPALQNQPAVSAANSHYVSTAGNDVSGDGSASNPWKTLKYAITKVPANQGQAIQLAAGTFIEDGLVEVPVGVSIAGAGKDSTILKAAASRMVLSFPAPAMLTPTGTSTRPSSINVPAAS